MQEKRETRDIAGGKEETSTRTETELTKVGGSTVTVTKTSKTTQRTFGKGKLLYCGGFFHINYFSFEVIPNIFT